MSFLRHYHSSIVGIPCSICARSKAQRELSGELRGVCPCEFPMKELPKDRESRYIKFCSKLARALCKKVSFEIDNALLPHCPVICPLSIYAWVLGQGNSNKRSKNSVLSYRAWATLVPMISSIMGDRAFIASISALICA